MHSRSQLSILALAVLLLIVPLMVLGVGVGRRILEKPREMDTAVGMRAPGKIRDAYGSTLKTFSLQGDDEYAYRFVCYDRDIGRIFKKDIPIPAEVWRASAESGTQRRNIENVMFSTNGKIVWSADGAEVAFFAHGQEVFRHRIP